MTRTWGVNERVRTTLPVGSVVLLGGDFSGLRSPAGDEVAAGGLAKFEPSTGTFLDWPASADGSIETIAVDGDTVYLGGSFRHINGVSRSSLAAVSLSTGQLLPWAPTVNKTVEALAVIDGMVYVGGSFDTVESGASGVRHLARFSDSGALDETWSTSIDLDDRVHDLLPTTDGQSLYVGGAFGGVAPVGWAAARNTKVSTGATATIDPVFRSGNNNGSSRTPVYAMSIEGNDLLVASGGSGGGCSLLDATTGETRWSYHTTGDVVAAAYLGGLAYCGGHFGGSESFGSFKRFKIAEVVPATGQVTEFSPRVNSALGVFAMSATESALFIGGDFDKVGRSEQQRFGMFRASDSVSTPSAPVAVAARAGDGKAVVTWDQPSTDGGAKIRKYHVYRALGSGSYDRIGTSTTLGFLDDTVSNGDPGDPDAEYHYYVRAQSLAGNGTPSVTVNATPQSGLVIPPSAPQQFAAAGTASGGSLNWAAPVWDGGSAITSYTIYRGSEPGSRIQLASVPPSARTFTDTSGAPGQPYYYRIAAASSVGEGPLTKERAITPNAGVPGRPTLSGTASAGRIDLQWEPPNEGGSPIRRYVLVRDGVRIARTPPSVVTFVDRDVVPGQKYKYKVKAINDYGSGPSSDRIPVVGR